MLLATTSRVLLTPRLLFMKAGKAKTLPVQNASCCFHSTAEKKSDSKALAVWEDLKALKRSPTPALALGLAGLIPFAAAPAYMVQTGQFMPELATIQLGYGATILSFLGGVRWGMLVLPDGPITPTWMQYTWAVTPSLIAWSSLLMPTCTGIITLMGGLGVAGFLDLIQYGYPAWFKGLRFVLTTVAVLSLWSTLMCLVLMKKKEKKKD